MNSEHPEHWIIRWCASSDDVHFIDIVFKSPRRNTWNTWNTILENGPSETGCNRFRAIEPRHIVEICRPWGSVDAELWNRKDCPNGSGRVCRLEPQGCPRWHTPSAYTTNSRSGDCNQVLELSARKEAIDSAPGGSRVWRKVWRQIGNIGLSAGRSGRI